MGFITAVAVRCSALNSVLCHARFGDLLSKLARLSVYVCARTRTQVRTYGWMDRGLKVCIDAGMHACMDVLMHGCMDAWAYGRMDEGVSVGMGGWTYVWMNGCILRCMDMLTY